MLEEKAKKSLRTILYDKVDHLKELIEEEYDSKLVDPVVESDTALNPYYYKESFFERLDNFEFLREKKSSLYLAVPDMYDIDFSSGLEVIQVIFEGLPGSFIEVPGNIYNYNPNRFGSAIRVLDSSFNNFIYLVDYTYEFNNDIETEFTLFPFSNLGSINIFSAAERLVEENFDSWIADFVKKIK